MLVTVPFTDVTFSVRWIAMTAVVVDAVLLLSCGSASFADTEAVAVMEGMFPTAGVTLTIRDGWSPGLTIPTIEHVTGLVPLQPGPGLITATPAGGLNVMTALDVVYQRGGILEAPGTGR